MKIRCIEKPDRLHMFDDITIDKEYKTNGPTIRCEGVYYYIIDDTGNKWRYHEKYFKVVEGAEVINELSNTETIEGSQSTDKNKNQYQHRPTTVIQTVRDLTKRD